ncbi:MAG TPA: wax ester/triacylglycerol synthase family O-acyltransferase [Chloroflexia bacterium]|nr:wax ester/triacylglycerol synthase family O-acyltransferase [Chloroflexia bacterium]
MGQTQLKHRLSSLDAEFLYLEKKEAPLHVGSTVIVDGEIAFEDFKQLISSKLPLLPRYRQKVVPAPFSVGHPTWENDPNFDINRHIFHRHLEAPGSMEQLRALFNRIMSKMLDRQKPLWEVYLIDGLEGNRTAIITKIHHAMVDGVAGVELMNVSYDTSPNPTPPPTVAASIPPAPKPYSFTQNYLEGLLDSTEEAVKSWNTVQRGLLDLAESLLRDSGRPLVRATADTLSSLSAPVSLMPFNQPLSGQRDVAWGEFPVERVSAIRAALGGTANDVILTIVARAVSRYLELHHQKTSGATLRIMVPVNMRGNEKHPAPGNSVSVMPPEIPMDIKNPLELYTFVNKKINELKEGRISDEANLLAALLGTVPPSVLATVGALAETPVPFYNIVCTNVPGPRVPLYALGKRITHFYPYVPVAYAVGLTCAILSYDHKFFFTLIADARALPDLNQQFKPLLEESFAELSQAAGVPIA